MRLNLRRLAHEPAVRVLSREGEETRLRIDGLVCDAVCARRSSAALRRLPGVTGVAVDFRAGTAVVRGTHHPEAAYHRAVQGQVAGLALRRLLARSFGRRAGIEAAR